MKANNIYLTRFTEIPCWRIHFPSYALSRQVRAHASTRNSLGYVYRKHTKHATTALWQGKIVVQDFTRITPCSKIDPAMSWQQLYLDDQYLNNIPSDLTMPLAHCFFTAEKARKMLWILIVFWKRNFHLEINKNWH